MSTPQLTDDAFFAALLEASGDDLDGLLADDFVIVDVMSGSVTDRETFVGAVRDRVVTFSGIDVADRATRVYGDAAVVVGRTAMHGEFADSGFSVASRYTHVFVRGGDESWLLASAQGTPITGGA